LSQSVVQLPSTLTPSPASVSPKLEFPGLFDVKI
jgi:hypothetical protein